MARASGTRLIGASVSTRGGIDRAVDNAVAIGAGVFQTHPTPGRQWRRPGFDDTVLQAFREKHARNGRLPHYLHAVYLINLATPDPALLQQSVDSLLHCMQLAAQLDAAGVVVHPRWAAMQIVTATSATGSSASQPSPICSTTSGCVRCPGSWRFPEPTGTDPTATTSAGCAAAPGCPSCLLRRQAFSRRGHRGRTPGPAAAAPPARSRPDTRRG